jgi:hypothetical protein
LSSGVSVLLISPSRSCRPDGNFGDAHLVCLGSYLRARTDARVEVIDLEDIMADMLAEDRSQDDDLSLFDDGDNWLLGEFEV